MKLRALGLGLAVAALGCPKQPAEVPVSVTETDAAVTIHGKGVTVEVGRAAFSLEFTASGAPVTTAADSGVYFTQAGVKVPLGSLDGWTLADDRVTLLVASAAGQARVEVSFPRPGVARVALTPPAAATADYAGLRLASPRSEAVYGLIERIESSVGSSEFIPEEVGTLDRRGTVVEMQLTCSLALYTPFFQTSRGYGLYVEGTSIGHYDIAAADRDVLELKFELPPGVTSFAFDFLDGPEHDQIVDRYTALAGRPFLPPEWAFKHWRWRDEHRLAAPALLDGVPMNADLVEDITQYEALGIPVGNYTLDRPWATGDVSDLADPEEPGFGDLRFDEARFPNPQQMVDALNARGYHVFLWVGPWATGVETHAEAVDGGFLAPGSRFLIDFTKPEAVAWWKRRLTPVVQMGFAGLKLDRGDEDTPYDVGQVYADGRTGRELKNAYPLLFAQVHHDLMRELRGDDFLNYPRAGYAGSQAYAGFSAGDVPGTNILGQATDLGLRAAILMVQHNAFNGFPIWGSDTGGYAQFGDREVFARWLEFSAFCPIMEIGGVGTHAPWDMPTDPRVDTEVIDIYRAYVTLHHALVPYTYAHAEEAHRSGRPIAKPLVFRYRNDARVTRMWQEYLYGDDILVAPVWKVGQREQPVYLPAGRWVDFWDRSRVVEGPADLVEPAPLDRIPIFIREGAAVLQAL